MISSRWNTGYRLPGILAEKIGRDPASLQSSPHLKGTPASITLSIIKSLLFIIDRTYPGNAFSRSKAGGNDGSELRWRTALSGTVRLERRAPTSPSRHKPERHARPERALVLSLVRQNGSLAKTEIARMTRLSAQTVSVIMRELEDEGLLLRQAPMRGKVGQLLHPDGAQSRRRLFHRPEDMAAAAPNWS